MSEPRILTEQEIENIADKAAGKAVKSILITLGIDADHPLEVQADMKFGRSFRQTCESARMKTMMTVIGVVVVATLALIGRSLWV